MITCEQALADIALAEKAHGQHTETWEEQDTICRSYTDRARAAIPEYARQLLEAMAYLEISHSHALHEVRETIAQCKACDMISTYRARENPE